TVTSAIDSFSVTFSGDLLASAANNANNYSLVSAGVDGLFGTGDDASYAVTPTYAGTGSRTVNFTINPNPLQPGQYRFATQASLTDRAGNAVTPYIDDFIVANPPAGQIEN